MSAAPSIVDTANRQLIVDTSTASLIRAAEELMVLTRTMKELWLFGGLDTLQKNESEEDKNKRTQLERDEALVVAGMSEWCRQQGSAIGGINSNNPRDVDMRTDSDDELKSASDRDQVLWTTYFDENHENEKDWVTEHGQQWLDEEEPPEQEMNDHLPKCPALEDLFRAFDFDTDGLFESAP